MMTGVELDPGAASGADDADTLAALAAADAARRGQVPDPSEPSQKPEPAAPRKRRKDAGKKRKHVRTRRPAPDLPGDDEIPAGLRAAPGQRDRAPARPKSGAAEARELKAQIGTLLGLVNTGFLAFAPCTCDPTKYDPELAPLIAAGAMHVDTCPRMWALDADEAEALTVAISDELRLHPEWGESLMATMGKWQPHIALAMAVGAIAISRATRPGLLIPIADKLSQEDQSKLAAMMAAGAAGPAPSDSVRRGDAVFTEAAGNPAGD